MNILIFNILLVMMLSTTDCKDEECKSISTELQELEVVCTLRGKNIKRSYELTKLSCAQMSETMLILRSESLKKSLPGFLRNICDNVWLGARTINGIWKWEDGTEVNLDDGNWTNDPLETIDNKCMVGTSVSQSQYNLSAEDCSTSKNIACLTDICKKPNTCESDHECKNNHALTCGYQCVEITTIQPDTTKMPIKPLTDTTTSDKTTQDPAATVEIIAIIGMGSIALALFLYVITCCYYSRRVKIISYHIKT